MGSPTTSALAVLDSGVISELRSLPSQGVPDLFSRLVLLFRETSPAALTQLHSELGRSACQDARAICHRLKSSAANIGARAFAAGVARLEALCAAGDLDGARSALDQLQSAQSDLLEALEKA